MSAGLSTKVVFLLGRLLVGGMFVSSGLDNLIELQGKVGYAASKGLPVPLLAVAAASLLLLVAGCSLISGVCPRIGVGATVLFLIPVTLVMHNFWALQGMQQMIELHSFMGNLGLLGSALMFLAIPEPWAFSLDRLFAALSHPSETSAVIAE
jgi:putative oxidoreductase